MFSTSEASRGNTRGGGRGRRGDHWQILNTTPFRGFSSSKKVSAYLSGAGHEKVGSYLNAVRWRCGPPSVLQGAGLLCSPLIFP